MSELKFNDFPFKTFDKIRYADTDKQGHVNNANFSLFLETGRVEVLYNPQYNLLSNESSFVIASLKLDFLNEITWPGQVDIGTGIIRVGNSSIVMIQKLFQNSKEVAIAETVIVQVNDKTKAAHPLSENARDILNQWIVKKE